jgi:hypothetical protein
MCEEKSKKAQSGLMCEQYKLETTGSHCVNLDRENRMMLKRTFSNDIKIMYLMTF